MPGGVELSESNSTLDILNLRRDLEQGGVGGGGARAPIVRLTSSESSSSGFVFFIELSGHKNMEDDSQIIPFSPPPSDRYSFYVKSFPQSERVLSRSESLDSSRRGDFTPVGSERRGPGTPVGLRNQDTTVDIASTNSSRTQTNVTLFRKVLVVEDSKFNLKMMKKLLTAYADEVVCAEDGEEGVAAVRRCSGTDDDVFDVIFMDSLMPNMNGITATKIIIGELKFPNPIIAVTGNMLPEDVQEFEDAGVLTVLGKPLELDKLAEVLIGECPVGMLVGLYMPGGASLHSSFIVWILLRGLT